MKNKERRGSALHKCWWCGDSFLGYKTSKVCNREECQREWINERNRRFITRNGRTLGPPNRSRFSGRASKHIEKVLAWRLEGNSTTHIAALLGVTKQAISQLCRRYGESDGGDNKTTSGNNHLALPGKGAL